MVNNRFFKEKNQSEASGLANKYAVNDLIRARVIIVINEHGENLGEVPRERALMMADEANLDLVQVGAKDETPIAKIMNFGKFLYEKKKQLNDSKKHQKVIQIKEIKIRPNIGDQDYKTKLNQAEQFFRDGKKVKFTLQFKGREAVMIEDLGYRLFARITKDLTDREIGVLVEEKEGRGGMFWSKIYFVK